MTQPDSTPDAGIAKWMGSYPSWLFAILVLGGSGILASSFHYGETEYEKLPKFAAFFLFVLIAGTLRGVIVDIQRTKSAVARIQDQLALTPASSKS